MHRETQVRAAERLRIGQDLHDGVGQMLSGVAFMSRALERKLATKLGPKDDGAADAAQIAEIAEMAMAQTRSLARELDRDELSAGSLAAALGEMASDFEKVFGVSCTFGHDAGVVADITDDATATHLYRIAQEAATNAIKHGEAKHVVIALGSPETEGDGRTVLTVQDDGKGFSNAESTTGKANGMGLRIMDYRAKAIGGSLSIRRRPEGGSLLTCMFPKEKRE